ncbi:MAG TPA: hypothetical protein VGJ26_14920, partial [Pirellulales bacterium]
PESARWRRLEALIQFGVITVLPLLICVGIAMPSLLGQEPLLRPDTSAHGIFEFLSGLVPFWLAVRGCQLVTGRTKVSADGVPAGLLVIAATLTANFWLMHIAWRIAIDWRPDAFGDLLETFGAVAQFVIVGVPIAVAYIWSRYANRY